MATSMIRYNRTTKTKYNANVKSNIGFRAEVAGKHIILNGKVDVRIINGLLDRGYIVQLNGLLMVGGIK